MKNNDFALILSISIICAIIWRVFLITTLLPMILATGFLSYILGIAYTFM